jgi:hypothetical protein
LVEVGKGAEQDRKTRPAMLVVAGVEGNDLIGCSVAVSLIEHLVERYESDIEIRKLLETTTVYVIPRLNSDAAEHFFARPKFETPLNGKSVDNDRDGLIDEDGPEDINGDGLITWMRIEDPEGEYILDPVDDRLLIKADHLKGEVGAWRYLTEGVDNDHDELWNEDGPGGVNFNRNFPHGFKFFAPDAGVHQVSEAETRALADFVVEHPNIGIVLTYGAADNLSKTPKGAPSAGRRKPATAIGEEDVGYYEVMGELYRKAIGLEKELERASVPGAFSDWMYYHRGRLSLAARAWSPDIAVELSKAAEEKERTASEQVGEKEESSESEREKGGKGKGKDGKDDEDKRNEKERKELKWFDEHAPAAFVKWRPIEHPDFPNQRAEVGGYSPFALTNPPAEMIEQVTAKHADFLTEVAQQLPRIGIRKTESRHLGRSVSTRLVIELDDEFILSGTRITNLPAIRGSGGMVEVRQIVRAPSRKKIDFEVVSMLAGQVEGTIELPDVE